MVEGLAAAAILQTEPLIEHGEADVAAAASRLTLGVSGVKSSAAGNARFPPLAEVGEVGSRAHRRRRSGRPKSSGSRNTRARPPLSHQITTNAPTAARAMSRLSGKRKGASGASVKSSRGESGSPKLGPHRIQCPTCARVIDMRLLDHVLAHERACPSARPTVSAHRR